MKKCPQCSRDYNDDSLSFCLDDGAELLFGPGTDEPATALLFGVAPSGGSSLEGATRPQILEAQPPASLGGSPERHSVSAHRAAEPRENAGHRAPQLLENAGRRATKPLAVIGLTGLLVVGGFFGYRYFSAAASRQINSVAVLPFQNRGGDADTDFLSDGLAESLIYRLSRLPSLKVSPVSSVIRYKGKDPDVGQIASELEVDAVMSGRLTQRGDDLAISVELIDARTKKLIWGEQYDRKMSELITTQREIAAEIADKLQLRLSGEGEKVLAKRYTENNDAYQLFLKGRFHFAKRNRTDVERSIEYFKQAIALDPNFALAHSALADSYNGMTAYPYMAPKEAVPLAKAAANRAIEIDPTLAEAYTALANSLACFDWNWKDAERDFRRAIELNPNDAGTHWRYGMFYLMPNARFDDAIAEGKRSLELEPLDLNHGANLSGLYFYARRYDEALEQARQVYSLDANFIVGRWALSQAYIQKGMLAEAIELNERGLQTDPTNPVFLRFAGIAYAKAGRRQDAEKIVDRFKEIAKTQYVMSYHIALIYSALGDKDKALAELETALTDHDYLLPRAKVEPFLDPLRDDPRFKGILKRLNLPE
ncbi:MAG: tetratricopeptide repeat protein [Acidobacteriota bacterium]